MSDKNRAGEALETLDASSLSDEALDRRRRELEVMGMDLNNAKTKREWDLQLQQLKLDIERDKKHQKRENIRLGLYGLIAFAATLAAGAGLATAINRYIAGAPLVP